MKTPLTLFLSFATFSTFSALANNQNPKAIMLEAQKKLEASGIAKKAKKKGDKFVDFTLPNALGKQFTLSQALKKAPVILTFYRGGWCPYCNKQLSLYQENLKKIQKAGAQLIALSPDTPASTQDTVSANEIEFEVLTDKDNAVASKYNLVFQVGKELQNVYKGFGIDLEKSQGNNSWELPIPATYVISSKGEIVYSFIDVNYKQRASIEDILKAISSL